MSAHLNDRQTRLLQDLQSPLTAIFGLAFRPDEGALGQQLLAGWELEEQGLASVRLARIGRWAPEENDPRYVIRPTLTGMLQALD